MELLFPVLRKGVTEPRLENITCECSSKVCHCYEQS